MSKKVAIVGGGISGLGAAWMLKKSGFEVTVYEEKAHPGGHMESFEFEVAGQMERCHMNPGHFRYSPHIKALSKLWDLPTYEQEFGVYYHHGDESWATFSHSEFFLAHADECRRFTDMMKELYERDAAAEASASTLHDYLTVNGFSPNFIQHIFSPVFSWVFGDIRKKDIHHISLVHVVELFALGIFSFFKPIVMLRFPKGGLELLEKLLEPLDGDVLLNTRVENVVRNEQGVLVVDSMGGQRRFDEIIFSVNFEIIQSILDTPHPMEASILNGLKYRDLHIELHGDKSIVPSHFFEEERIGVILTDNTATDPMIPFDSQGRISEIMASTITGDMSPVDRAALYADRLYKLEKLTIESLIARGNVFQIQGFQNTWYCGLSTVPGFTEFCMVSGFAVAEKLGAKYPIEHNENTQKVYENVKRMMFNSFPSLRIFS